MTDAASDPLRRTFSRRRILQAGAGGLIAASTLAVPGLARADDREALRQNAAFRLFVPLLWRDGPPLAATLSQRQVYQGGAILVRANHRLPAVATVFGRQYALSDDITGSVGFISIGTGDPPGPTNLSVSITNARGEPETTTIPITVLETEWTVDYIDLPPGSGEILDDPDRIEAEYVRLMNIYKGQVPKLWDGKWISPAPGAPITGYFGEQRSFNGGPVSGHHGGTDFGTPGGTPIISANRGVVVLAEELYVRGNMVIIDHGGGVYTGYSHLSRLEVSVGQPVTKGQYIGDSGATGFVAGAHLHWELAVGGILIDGLRWLDGSQGF